MRVLLSSIFSLQFTFCVPFSKLTYYLYYQALKIVRLRHCQQDGVVLSLCPPFTDDDISLRVGRRLRQNLKEEGLSDMVGTGAGNEVAARFEQLHRPQVNLLVAALRGRNTVPVLGEGGWIENDRLEASAHFVVLLQQVEGIPFAEVDV